MCVNLTAVMHILIMHAFRLGKRLFFLLFFGPRIFVVAFILIFSSVHLLFQRSRNVSCRCFKLRSYKYECHNFFFAACRNPVPPKGSISHPYLGFYRPIEEQKAVVCSLDAQSTSNTSPREKSTFYEIWPPQAIWIFCHWCRDRSIRWLILEGHPLKSIVRLRNTPSKYLISDFLYRESTR